MRCSSPPALNPLKQSAKVPWQNYTTARSGSSRLAAKRIGPLERLTFRSDQEKWLGFSLKRLGSNSWLPTGRYARFAGAGASGRPGSARTRVRPLHQRLPHAASTCSGWSGRAALGFARPSSVEATGFERIQIPAQRHARIAHAVRAERMMWRIMWGMGKHHPKILTKGRIMADVVSAMDETVPACGYSTCRRIVPRRGQPLHD